MPLQVSTFIFVLNPKLIFDGYALHSMRVAQKQTTVKIVLW
jgi:hypothetical protein